MLDTPVIYLETQLDAPVIILTSNADTMNNLEACSIESPYAKEDICAKITINDITDAFGLKDIATPGQEYTLSFWLKSTVSGFVRTTGGGTFKASSEWKKCVSTFTAESADCVFSFDTVGTFYIFRAQLEIGNKASDYRPAVEDMAMVSDLDDYSTKSEVSQTAENILLSVKRIYQTIDGMANYSTTTEMESAINQSAESITSKVSATYATKEALADIEIGGRNLLLNTGPSAEKAIVVNSASYATSGISEWTNSDGVLTLDGEVTGEELYYRFMAPMSDNLYTLQAGKEYTISGKAKINTESGNLTALKVRSQHYISAWTGGLAETITAEDTNSKNTGGEGTKLNTPYIFLTTNPNAGTSVNTDGWVEFTFTHAIPKDATGVYFSVQVYYDGSWSGTVQLTELKLEKGNKATDWTPAPEDMATIEGLGNYATKSEVTQTAENILSKVESKYQTKDAMNNYSTTAEMNSAINQKADEITQSVSQTYTTKGELSGYYTKTEIDSQIIQTADSIKSTVSATYTTKEETTQLNTRISTVEQTASGIVVQLESVQSTANTAKENAANAQSTADNAQLTADTAKTNAATAQSIADNAQLAANLAQNAADEAQNTADTARTEASDAAKTATNFMSFDATEGVQIGNKTSGSWSGFRTQITSTAFNILNAAGETLASYGAKLIELGKNATDAIISLCGGKGAIEYDANDDYIQVTSDKVRLRGTNQASLYATTNNLIQTDLMQVWESAVDVSNDWVHIYSNIGDVDPNTMEGTSVGSEIYIDHEQLSLSGESFVMLKTTGSNSLGVIVDDDFAVNSIAKFNSTILDSYNTYINNGLAVYTGSADAAIDPDTTLEHLILTNKNVPLAGFMYIETNFYSTKSVTAHRMQKAYPYDLLGSQWFRYYHSGAWSDWFEKPILVASGTSGIWTYEKWSNGIAKLYGQVDVSELAINTALGDWYRSVMAYSNGDNPYPVTFTQLPNVTGEFLPENAQGAKVWFTGQGTVSLPPNCYLIRPTTSSAVTGQIHFNVTGKWK